ncbi:MAG: hypothetical protein GWP50_04810, partial [Proteobacteria bacterium]|nr:hypothetical protein [Pseudomonadota bacterium]
MAAVGVEVEAAIEAGDALQGTLRAVGEEVAQESAANLLAQSDRTATVEAQNELETNSVNTAARGLKDTLGETAPDGRPTVEGGEPTPKECETAIKDANRMRDETQTQETEGDGAEFEAEGLKPANPVDASLVNQEGSAFAKLRPRSRQVLDGGRKTFQGMTDNIGKMLESGGKIDSKVEDANAAMKECDAASDELTTLYKKKKWLTRKIEGYEDTAAGRRKWNEDVEAAKAKHKAAKQKMSDALDDIPEFRDRIKAKCGRYGKEMGDTMMANRKLLLALGGFCLFLKLTADALSGCYRYIGVKSTELTPSGLSGCKFTDGKVGRDNCKCIDGMDQSENQGKTNKQVCEDTRFSKYQGTPYCCDQTQYQLCNNQGDDPTADDYIEYTYVQFTPAKVLAGLPAVAINTAHSL